MSEPNEIERLEQRLSTAMRAHGESIEPAADAYARLAEAVNESPAGRFSGAVRPWQPWRRPLGFVAATAMIAGLGAYVISLQPDQLVDTVNVAPANADFAELVPTDDSDNGLSDGLAGEDGDPGDAAADSRTADSIQSPPDSSGRSGADVAGEGGRVGTDPLRRLEGLTYAPIRMTKQEAAEAFLDLIAVDYAALEEAGDEVRVRSVGERGADGPVVSVLSLDAIGGGYVVTEARSDSIEFDVDNRLAADPVDDNIDDRIAVIGAIDLSGRRTGPGATVEVDLHSAVDGHPISTSSHPVDDDDDNGDDGDEAEFDFSIPVTGVDRAWLVLRSAADEASAGDSRRAEPFAARPVLYVGDPDPSGYSVVRLPPHDPDNGLVIRRTPNGQRLGVVELGSTGVRRRAVAARRAGGLSWWPVTAPDGTEGWVASRYLAANDPGPDSRLLELARDFIAMVGPDGSNAIDSPEVESQDPLLLGSITEPLPVVVGVEGGLASSLAGLQGQPDGLVGSLAEFFGADRWNKAEIFVPDGYRQPGAAAAARSYFGDLPSVVIRSLNPTTGGWERVHLFVSRRQDDLSLVGIVREVEPIPLGDNGP